MPGVWEYATAGGHRQGRQGLAADELRDLPLRLRPAFELPDQALAEFEQTGRIRWVSDLAEIPQKFGVTNVYAELGTSFANSAVAHPKFCAALVGTLIKGMGADHVLWGTDSVWYGSPQWQIEAMRRLEIPEDMQKKYGFAALGDANSATKQQIFSGNAARDVQHPGEEGRQHQDAGLFRGPLRGAQERLRAGRRGTLEPALRLRSRRLSMVASRRRSGPASPAGIIGARHSGRRGHSARSGAPQ